MTAIKRSKRVPTSMVSSKSCLSSTFKVKWAEIVSARRPGSSILARGDNTSGGIFLFN